jgi:serine/threonine protein phosphatase PrpC
MVRDGEISRDEARDHPDKNVISRALGSHPEVEVTSWPRPFVVRPGDRFLLSSDGLHDVVREADILRLAGEGPPDVACRNLVAFTREQGAPDNVSVVLLAMPAPATDEIASTRPIPVAS